MHIHAQTCSGSKLPCASGYRSRVGVTFKFSLSSIILCILPLAWPVVDVWCDAAPLSVPARACGGIVGATQRCCLGLGQGGRCEGQWQDGRRTLAPVSGPLRASGREDGVPQFENTVWTARRLHKQVCRYAILGW